MLQQRAASAQHSATRRSLLTRACARRTLADDGRAPWPPKLVGNLLRLCFHNLQDALLLLQQVLQIGNPASGEGRGQGKGGRGVAADGDSLVAAAPAPARLLLSCACSSCSLPASRLVSRRRVIPSTPSAWALLQGTGAWVRVAARPRTLRSCAADKGTHARHAPHLSPNAAWSCADASAASAACRIVCTIASKRSMVATNPSTRCRRCWAR